jgi:hypothetical protein
MNTLEVEYRRFRKTKYFIGSDGSVVNSLTGKKLKPCNTAYGYKQLILSDPTIPYKSYVVHRLVAEVFIGELGKLHVNHIDRNRANNCANNLELVTPKQNNIHSAKLGAKINKITKEDLLAIKKHLALSILSQREIAFLVGVSQSIITRINQGKLQYYGLQ